MPVAQVAGRRPAGRRVGGIRRRERRAAPAFHRRGGEQEVMVVGDIADPVGALRVDLRQVGAIRRDRRFVGARGIRVAADAHVDVRRHVRQVPGARDQRGQPIRARQRAPGPRRTLHHVDPVVIGAGVRGRQAQCPRQQVGGRGGPGLLAAVCLPPVVGVQVEQRLRRQRGDLGVVRKPPGQRLHPGGVGVFVDGQCGAGMARRERGDQATVARRRGRRPVPVARASASATRGAAAASMSALMVGPSAQARPQ